MGSCAKSVHTLTRNLGQFVAGIAVLFCILCAPFWILDEIRAHISVRVDHSWWAYQAWHSWWWVILPLALVAMGRLWHRRIIGRGMWTVGVLWLIFVGFSSSLGLWVYLLHYLASRIGWLVGSVLTLAATAVGALMFAALGGLAERARKRWRSIDRLAREICWTPDSTS